VKYVAGTRKNTRGSNDTNKNTTSIREFLGGDGIKRITFFRTDEMLLLMFFVPVRSVSD
jgi:hypothetical protein